MKTATLSVLISSLVMSAAALVISPAHAQGADSMLHHTKYDTFTDGAHGIDRPDPYTDGARDVRSPRDPYSEGARDIKSPRDPYTDGARDIKGARDPFTDGARAGSGQIAGMDRTGVSAPPAYSLEQADFAA